MRTERTTGKIQRVRSHITSGSGATAPAPEARDAAAAAPLMAASLSQSSSSRPLQNPLPLLLLLLLFLRSEAVDLHRTRRADARCPNLSQIFSEFLHPQTTTTTSTSVRWFSPTGWSPSGSELKAAVFIEYDYHLISHFPPHLLRRRRRLVFALGTGARP